MLFTDFWLQIVKFLDTEYMLLDICTVTIMHFTKINKRSRSVTWSVEFSVLNRVISSWRYPGSGNSLGGGGGGGWKVAGRRPLGGGAGDMGSKLKSSIFLHTCKNKTVNKCELCTVQTIAVVLASHPLSWQANVHYAKCPYYLSLCVRMISFSHAHSNLAISIISPTHYYALFFTLLSLPSRVESSSSGSSLISSSHVIHFLILSLPTYLL